MLRLRREDTYLIPPRPIRPNLNQLLIKLQCLLIDRATVELRRIDLDIRLQCHDELSLPFFLTTETGDANNRGIQDVQMTGATRALYTHLPLTFGTIAKVGAGYLMHGTCDPRITPKIGQ
jgi:hypothetical protein